jgi:hypothetical protein
MAMDIDPLEMVEDDDDKEDDNKSHRRLNAAVAVTVALLATFMGICDVKDDNIVQGMQAAQADKIDYWSYYQARNIREEIARATIVQLKLQAVGASAEQKSGFDAAIKDYEKLAADQNKKKEDLKVQAEQAQKNYDALNFRDDQFDLSKASIAIAISLLAVAALTQLWWLYLLSLLPSVFGVVMGIAGLTAGSLHPTALIAPLT